MGGGRGIIRGAENREKRDLSFRVGEEGKGDRMKDSEMRWREKARGGTVEGKGGEKRGLSLREREGKGEGEGECEEEGEGVPFPRECIGL